MKSKVKISKLKTGAVIEITSILSGKEVKREEFISQVEGSAVSTLFRDSNDNIIESAYLVTQENGEKFLSRYTSQLVKKEGREYDKLNRKLKKYEKKNAA